MSRRRHRPVTSPRWRPIPVTYGTHGQEGDQQTTTEAISWFAGVRELTAPRKERTYVHMHQLESKEKLYSPLREKITYQPKAAPRSVCVNLIYIPAHASPFKDGTKQAHVVEPRSDRGMGNVDRTQLRSPSQSLRTLTSRQYLLFDEFCAPVSVFQICSRRR